MVPKLFPYLNFLIYRDSKCLLSSAESPFAGRKLLCFYLTSKFRKKRRFTAVATVICFQENIVKGSLLTVSVIATTSRRTTHSSWCFPLRWRQHYGPKLSNSVAVVAVFLVVQLMVLETCWWVKSWEFQWLWLPVVAIRLAFMFLVLKEKRLAQLI